MIHVPYLPTTHNINHLTDKAPHHGSRHYLGTNNNSPNTLVGALCWNHRASSKTAEPALKTIGRRTAS